VLPKTAFHLLFLLPKSSFGEHKVLQKRTRNALFRPKFWEDRTNLSECAFDARFKGTSNGLVIENVEQFLEGAF